MAADSAIAPQTQWALLPGWVERLTDDIAHSQSRVALVIAPACWGKSEIAGALCRQNPDRGALLSIDEEHGDLLGFVRGLTDALGHITDGPRLSYTALLERLPLQSDRVSSLTAWMSSHLRSLEATIVLDGLESIVDYAEIVRLIDELIRAQAHVRWLLTSRAVGSLPVASWMAQGLMSVPIESKRLRALPAESPLHYKEYDGWPLGIAWLTAGRLCHAEAVRDRRTYEQWLSRALADLSCEQRAFVRRTILLKDFDSSVLAELGMPSGAHVLHELYALFPFLFEPDPQRLRYHRDFRRFAIEHLTRSGELILARAVQDIGAALERTGAFRAALELYVRAEQTDPLAALLERHGLAIASGQPGDVIDRAVRSLGEHPLSQGAVVLALKASAESRAGRLDTSESLFLHAIETADERLKSEIAYLYGCDLSRRNRFDCSTVFEKLLNDGRIAATREATIRAALAQAYVMQGKNDPALAHIQVALEQRCSIDDDKVHALIDARAAFVTLYASKDHASASKFAERALETALHEREYVVAIGCCSVLNVIAQEREDVRGALFYLDQLANCSVLSGNVEFQQYALLAMLEIEVERKKDDRIDRLMRSLRAFDLHYERLLTSDGFLPSRALQLTWSGDFERAYLLPAGSQCRSADRR